jgi:hypothetical protein
MQEKLNGEAAAAFYRFIYDLEPVARKALLRQFGINAEQFLTGSRNQQTEQHQVLKDIKRMVEVSVDAAALVDGKDAADDQLMRAAMWTYTKGVHPNTKQMIALANVSSFEQLSPDEQARYRSLLLQRIKDCEGVLPDAVQPGGEFQVKMRLREPLRDTTGSCKGTVASKVPTGSVWLTYGLKRVLEDEETSVRIISRPAAQQ